MPVESKFSEPPDVSIIATYGGATLAPAPPPAKPKRQTLWDLIPKMFSTFRSIVLNLLFIGFLATVGILTYQALTRSPTTIEAFSVPPQLAKQGLTGTVIAHKLWDEIAKIQETSGTKKEQVALLPVARQFDIVEPDSGISFLSLTNMLRALLNRPQKIIGGEITCKTSDCTGDALHLTIRLLDHGREVVIDAPLDLSISEGPFKPQALAVLETLDPYSVASYYAGDGDNIERAREMAIRLYRTKSPQADWAANMLGTITPDEEPFVAIDWFERAIEINPEFAIPWINWGGRLHDMERYEEAIEKYKRATEIDPRYAFPWNGWGNRLGELGRYEDSLEKYREALVRAPTLGMAARNWQLNLSKAIQHSDPSHCPMAKTQIPKFLDHAAELVDAAKVSEFQDILAECEEASLAGQD